MEFLTIFENIKKTKITVSIGDKSVPFEGLEPVMNL
jgi:hypothetical protein